MDDAHLVGPKLASHTASSEVAKLTNFQAAALHGNPVAMNSSYVGQLPKRTGSDAAYGGTSKENGC